jgi:hypothetical protein
MADRTPLISLAQKADITEKLAEQKINLSKLRAVVEASKAAGMETIELDRAVKQGETMISVLEKLVQET